MIKLIDYRNDEKGKIVFINKSCIGGMIRKEQEGLTRLWDNGVTECAGYDFKETPEEILAMPDIEEGDKVLDWEQRRYEIAKDITAAIYTRPNVKGTLLNYNHIVSAADGLIRELKKGDEKMKIEEQVLSIEQMKHLQDLGIDTSDASMAYYNISRDNQPDKWILGIANIKVASVMLSNGITEMEPTYTIGDLIEKLPKYFHAKEHPIEMCAINGNGAFVVDYFNIANSCEKDDTIKNALYKSLCWIAESHKELLEVKK